MNWDVEADVVVVGFGAAGVAAAVTAHELGAKVVILEKAPEGEEGGNTRVAGQGYLNTSSAEAGRRLSDRAVRTLHRAGGDGAGVGGGDGPEQCLARKPRRRSAGASASAGRDRISRPARRATACTNSTTARPTAIPIPGSGSRAWSKQRPIPILYETPGRELIQHDITKEILGVRAAAAATSRSRSRRAGGWC